MDAIGVREEQAVDLVKEVSGKNATFVLDPTLYLPAFIFSIIGYRYSDNCFFIPCRKMGLESRVVLCFGFL